MLQNPYALKKIKFNNIAYVAPAIPGSLDENTPAHEKDDIEWNILAGCDKVTETPETEDDALTYFDPATKSRVEEKNTRVKSDKITMELVHWSPYLLRIIDRQLQDPEPGVFQRIHETDDPSALVWLKIEDYNNAQELLATRYYYGRIRHDGDITKDGKYSKPKLVLEVIPSVYNGRIATVALVGPSTTPAPANAPAPASNTAAKSATK